jgi:hypothetical protein
MQRTVLKPTPDVSCQLQITALSPAITKISTKRYGMKFVVSPQSKCTSCIELGNLWDNRKSTSREVRGISLSPTTNRGSHGQNYSCAEAHRKQSVSPLRSGLIRRSLTPSKESLIRDAAPPITTSFFPENHTDSTRSAAHDVDTNPISTVATGSSSQIEITNEGTKFRPQLDKESVLLPQVELDIFLSNLCRASGVHSNEKSENGILANGHSCIGATLAKKVRDVWSRQPLSFRWKGIMKDKTVVDYSQSHPFESGSNVGEPAHPPDSPPKRRHCEDFEVICFPFWNEIELRNTSAGIQTWTGQRFASILEGTSTFKE